MEFFAWFVVSAKAFGLLLPSKKCGKYNPQNENKNTSRQSLAA